MAGFAAVVAGLVSGFAGAAAAGGGLSTDLPTASAGAAASGKPSRSEVDALDDALDRIDEF